MTLVEIQRLLIKGCQHTIQGEVNIIICNECAGAAQGSIENILIELDHLRRDTADIVRTGQLMRFTLGKKFWE